MDKSKTIGVRGRLLFGFTGITIIFLIAMFINLSMLTSVRKFTNQVVSYDLPSYDATADLNGALYATQLSLVNWILTNDSKYKDQFKSLWDVIDKRVTLLDQLSAMSGVNAVSFQKMLSDTKSDLSDLKSFQTQLISNPDKLNATKLLQDEVSPIFIKTVSHINSFDASNTETNMANLQFNKLQNGANEISTQLNTLIIAAYSLACLGIIAAIIIALLTSRLITRHINLYRQYSERIASGDLTHFISVETSDELGLLGKDLNTMTGSLSSITSEITEACHGMVSMLEEVRHVVDTQSSGASEQASSINEITASIGEIEKSTTQTLGKAKALGDVAKKINDQGQSGLEAVEQSVQGMKNVRDKVQLIAQSILDLSNKTQQVGEITAVVNNLAQQSKMLALNASIEAAKAGESGKGFAVVAAEVKNLAEQSESSTEQVQKILEEIRHATEKAVMATEEGTKGVDYGTTLVEQTGEIIRGLNEVIRETTMASQQIEAAVRQESAGIEQITAGMTEINQVTHSFVESVKQTTDAMSNLSTVAKDLKKHVDVYKVREKV